MLRNQPKCKKMFLAVDVFFITLAFSASFSIVFCNARAPEELGILFWVSHAALYVVFLVSLVALLLSRNVYKRHIIYDMRAHAFGVLKAFLILCLAVSALQLICNAAYLFEYGYKLLAYFFLIGVSTLLAVRIVLSFKVLPFLFGKGILARNVLIVGSDECARELAASLAGDRHGEFRIVGFVDDEQREGTAVFNHIGILGRFEDIRRIARERNVDELILALDFDRYDRIMGILKECLRTGKVVRLYSSFLRVVTQKLNVEFYNKTPVIMLSQYALDDYAWFVKRLFDVVASAAALVILLPVFLLVAVGIKKSSRGPVIFRQMRIGKAGRPFEFYKFRSMHMNGDDTNHKRFTTDFILNKGEVGRRGAKVFKISDDPRVFRFGRFLRKTSLDEFPQLINVLKGDMTLVGPRPSLGYEWEVYHEWHKRRADVPPGCTGLWQTLGRSSVTFEEMVILDLYYISNMTLLLDLKIIMQTVPVLLFGKGAY